MGLLGVGAATSCGQATRGDDDGKGGAGGGLLGSGGSSGKGGITAGSSSGGQGSGAAGNVGSSGSSARGGTAGTSQSGGGGDVASLGGEGGMSGVAGESGTGTVATGGSSGAANGGSSGTANGGSSGTDTAGAAGECTGQACPPVNCGDGTLVPGEGCDDGNTANDDGCSSDCTIEPGFTCSAAVCDAPGGTCKVLLPAVFRDFNAHGATGGHPDFQPGFNSPGAVLGLVQDLLDTDGKPALTTTIPSSTLVSSAFLHGPTEFAEWYRDGAPGSGPIPGEIVLWDDGAGGYVNRWGKNGEQWLGDATQIDYGTPVAGLPAGMGCSSPEQPGYGCTPGVGQQCYDPCVPWNSTLQACCADIPAPNGFDGNPLFHPLDGAAGVLTEPRAEGKVPSQYGWLGYPWESTVATKLGISTPIETATAPFPSATHNFSFTTEATLWFRYSATMQATITAGGDDDMWVFVNRHLAIDLGGWHIPLSGTLTINGSLFTAVSQVTADDSGAALTKSTRTGSAASFGMFDGGIYAIQIFHAERQVEASTFKFGVRGLGVGASVCRAN